MEHLNLFLQSHIQFCKFCYKHQFHVICSLFEQVFSFLPKAVALTTISAVPLIFVNKQLQQGTEKKAVCTFTLASPEQQTSICTHLISYKPNVCHLHSSTALLKTSTNYLNVKNRENCSHTKRLRSLMIIKKTTIKIYGHHMHFKD